MTINSLDELCVWARAQINSYVMLGYQLYKVNGQIPGKVLILLRESRSSRANVEIEVEHNPDRDSPYLAVFSPLPFNVGYPSPIQLRPTFNTQQEVIHWIKTGQKRL